MSATVETSEEDGEYTAVDSEKGAVGIGNTRAMALAALAVRLGAEETMDTEDQTELRALADRTRERFEKQGVTEDAIAARSE